MAMAERDDDGFLARWSRRKQAAREAARQPEAAESEAPLPDATEAPDQLAEVAELPDPDTLDASSDFSVFLRREVPLETHQKALRRLWRLDPIYNRIDGLDDYCEDFTDQAKVVKGLRTAYKVGRGFLEQISDAAADKEQDADKKRPAAPTELAADQPGELAPAPADRASPEPSKRRRNARPTSRRRAGADDG